MIETLKPMDKIAIVSLSSGILGETFVKHEYDLGVKRLEEFGLVPVFMPNSLKGLDYISNHPEKRADDLIEAFENKEIKAIICAIGGEDAYKTFPYLVGNKKLEKAVKNNPKIFLGYSDTTNHHLILHKLGLPTFYGQSFLTDLAEFEDDMLEYSKKYFKMLFDSKESYEIEPADFWFEERTDFSANAVGTKRISHKNTGYEFLKSTKTVNGKLLGGCIEVLGELAGYFYDEDQTSDEFHKKVEIIKAYDVFPTLDEWKDKIMFIETANIKIAPETFRSIIKTLKEKGVFSVISGMIVGKPMDNAFYDEYKQVLLEELAEFDFPLVLNANFGHGFPHAILPYDADAEINPSEKTFKILKTTLGTKND